MVRAVMEAVGLEAAATASVFAEIVDLATVLEVNRAGVPLTEEVQLLIEQFQTEAIDLVVKSELRRIGSQYIPDTH